MCFLPDCGSDTTVPCTFYLLRVVFTDYIGTCNCFEIVQCNMLLKINAFPVKRGKVLSKLKKDKIQVAFLQESHLSDSEHAKLNK